MTTVLAPAPAHRSPRPQPRPTPRPSRPAPSGRHLRVVQPEERTARRLTPAGGILLTLVLFVVLAALAGAHSLIAQGQIRLDRVDAELQAEQARYQELRRDLAIVESPERIVAAAAAQGMVAPEDLVYLQPSEPTEGGGGVVSAAGATEPVAGSWSTVKPLLETPSP